MNEAGIAEIPNQKSEELKASFAENHLCAFGGKERQWEELLPLLWASCGLNTFWIFFSMQFPCQEAISILLLKVKKLKLRELKYFTQVTPSTEFKIWTPVYWLHNTDSSHSSHHYQVASLNSVIITENCFIQSVSSLWAEQASLEIDHVISLSLSFPPVKMRRWN